MYAQDYGFYPTELSQITPDYFKTLPECPEVMSMTYAYRPVAKARGAKFQDTYEIYCSGKNHESSSALPDYPRYNGVTGVDLGVHY